MVSLKHELKGDFAAIRMGVQAGLDMHSQGEDGATFFEQSLSRLELLEEKILKLLASIDERQ